MGVRVSVHVCVRVYIFVCVRARAHDLQKRPHNSAKEPHISAKVPRSPHKLPRVVSSYVIHIPLSHATQMDESCHPYE